MNEIKKHFDEENEKNTVLEHATFAIGGALLIFGLIVAVIILVNYNCRGNQLLLSYFKTTDGISELATALVGTTGLFWSLGGTIFFIYTIIQTRIEIKLQVNEMKQTNSSLVSQRYQTTFFNLLDNHTRLISNLNFGGSYGNEGIAKLYNRIHYSYQSFLSNFHNGLFPDFQSTSSHPFCAIGENISSVESYINNFVTILKFIDKKMDEKDFYHELLYNYLSVDEKFLIGAYINTNRNADQSYIEDHPFKFLKYYNSHHPVFTYRSETYFPAVNLKTKLKSHNQFDLAQILDDKYFFDYELDYNQILFEKPFTLISATLKISDNKDKEYFNKKIRIECPMGEDSSIRISEFNDILKPILKEYYDYDRFNNVSIDFEFNYGERNYSVIYKFNFHRKPSNTNNIENDSYQFSSSHRD